MEFRDSYSVEYFLKSGFKQERSEFKRILFDILEKIQKNSETEAINESVHQFLELTNFKDEANDSKERNTQKKYASDKMLFWFLTEVFKIQPINAEICRIILEKMVNPNIRNGFGQTILHIFCKEHAVDVEVIKLLLEKVNPDLVDSYENSALIYLCKNSSVQLDIIKLFENFNESNKYGQTNLHAACKNKNPDFKVINYLLDKNLNPNQKDCYGNTPFSYACANKHTPLSLIKIIKDDVLSKIVETRKIMQDLYLKQKSFIFQSLYKLHKKQTMNNLRNLENYDCIDILNNHSLEPLDLKNGFSQFIRLIIEQVEEDKKQQQELTIKLSVPAKNWLLFENEYNKLLKIYDLLELLCSKNWNAEKNKLPEKNGKYAINKLPTFFFDKKTVITREPMPSYKIVENQCGDLLSSTWTDPEVNWSAGEDIPSFKK